MVFAAAEREGHQLPGSRGRWLGLVTLLVTLAAPLQVAAQERAAVTLVAEAQRPPTERVGRLSAELTALGFHPTEVYRQELGAPGPADVARLAEGWRATVVIVIATDRAEAVVWYVEATGAQVTLVETITADPSTVDPEGELALRTAELLRARGLLLPAGTLISPTEPDAQEPETTSSGEGGGGDPSSRREGSLSGSFESSPPPGVGEPGTLVAPAPIVSDAVDGDEPLPQPAEVDQRTARPTERWSPHRLDLGAGAGVTWSPGGLGALATAHLSAAFYPHPNPRRSWLGVHLLGHVPLHQLRLSGPEGVARTWLGLVGAGARARLGQVRRRVGGLVDVGAALVVLTMEGRANPPLTSGEDRVLTGAPYLRLSMTVRLSEHVQVRVDAMAAVALSRAVVSFAGREAASWGRPALSFGISLDGLAL